jgi:ubiquinone/menaquinone biosynthesis C-methylase UbiE
MSEQERVSGFFDSYAGEFAAIYGTSSTPWNRLINRWFRKSMRLRFEKTIEGCAPVEGRSVLDVGCGPGHYGIALARRGAARVYGIDFAPGMIEIARKNARTAEVEDRCEFAVRDFLEMPTEETFDYAIVMGFMDYVGNPRDVIDKVLGMTGRAAFFSFPLEGGFLAWQRKLRYRRRCDLYLYPVDDLKDLFSGVGQGRVHIEKISRDAFVRVATARPS